MSHSTVHCASAGGADAGAKDMQGRDARTLCAEAVEEARLNGGGEAIEAIETLARTLRPDKQAKM